ncbi:hypothetical protein [Paenibacillus crassostreae]|uniref:Aldose epimerase n=1 Tax=Paenibacillus crassostreae TaxID=1763538 RepID=A0A167CJA0_9BACL|nr:hypothetical protein [Paenibacillus crassostreae]AOZ91816.1 hypothetical protein LPB68_05990 [Paenibacillus crassostreae]OAB73261.1 hypothetical protein PNBC_14300 [Paenibacillus crassostreae]
MFTCYAKQDQFETYVLASEDRQIYIEVVPERGCIISKYMYNNESIFYLEQETLEDLSKNIRGGNPILFPISSYLVDETYYYKDTAYQLKQHGFARNLVGQVIHTSADDNSASITLEMVDNEETLIRYPFHFKLIMQYTLNENGLSIQATIHNMDDKVMPFYLGYHPYFYVADKENLALQVPSSTYKEMIPNSIVEDKFNFNQDESNVIYDQLQSNSCEMIDHTRQLKVTITSEDVYQYIVLWALQGKPFVCIEPWMAPVNGMNVGQGIQLLEANQSHTSTIQIKAESLI